MIIADPSDTPYEEVLATKTSSSRISPTLISQVTRIRLNPETGEFTSFPEPSSSAELDQWLRSIELSLKDGDIPRKEWPDAAILFLDKDCETRREMMRLRKDRYDQEGSNMWSWEEFVDVLRAVLIERESRAFSFRTLRDDHPVATAVAGSLVVAAISPPLLVGTLNVLGFGSGGVAAGSIAAGAQSMFYGGATAGLFSACQSAGAVGLSAAATTVTSVLGGATGFTLLGRGKNGDENAARPETVDDPVSDADSSPPPPYRA